MVTKISIPEDLEGDGPCERCGEKNIRWYVESQFWNVVISLWKVERWTGGDPGAILCVQCFVTIANEVGYDVPSWELRPAWPAVRR